MSGPRKGSWVSEVTRTCFAVQHWPLELAIPFPKVLMSMQTLIMSTIIGHIIIGAPPPAPGELLDG